jgi:hypothetical protein
MEGIKLKFLSPTNAPLYYIYKMLKYTARSSSDCSYIFSVQLDHHQGIYAEPSYKVTQSQTARHTIHTTAG